MAEKIVSFRAGRCTRQGKQVTPQAQPGTVELVTLPDDGLTHLRWRTRPEGKLELDLIVFEGDARWRRLGKVTDGRVFVLEWIVGDQKEVFWMQEPSDDGDEDAAEKMNGFLKPPPKVAAAAAPAPVAAAAAPAPAAVARATPVAAPGAVSMSFLSGLLQNMSGATAGAGAQQGQTGLPFSEIFTSRALLAVLRPEDEAELLPHLPPLDQSPHGLRAFLQSPQFQQALQAFNGAVMRGHAEGILRQLGVDPAHRVQAATASESFLKTLQEQLQKKKE